MFREVPGDFPKKFGIWKKKQITEERKILHESKAEIKKPNKLMKQTSTLISDLFPVCRKPIQYITIPKVQHEAKRVPFQFPFVKSPIKIIITPENPDDKNIICQHVK